MRLSIRVAPLGLKKSQPPQMAFQAMISAMLQPGRFVDDMDLLLIRVSHHAR
jgi:hypothetical protein